MIRSSVEVLYGSYRGKICRGYFNDYNTSFLGIVTGHPLFFEIKNKCDQWRIRADPLAVILYFCRGLFGLSGIVISINPAATAGC